MFVVYVQRARTFKTLRFGWDSEKAAANPREHPVSFEDAQMVFADENAKLMVDPDHSDDEDRFFPLGLSDRRLAGMEDEPQRCRGGAAARGLVGRRQRTAQATTYFGGWQTEDPSAHCSLFVNGRSQSACLSGKQMNHRRSPAARSHLIAVSISALLFAVSAQAEVALDTYGPGDASPGLNWSLAADNAGGPGQWLAVPFSLSSAATVDDILTSIQGSGTYQLGIVAGAGLPSGDFVFSTMLTDPVANSQVSGLGWALQAGDYWLVSKADVSASGSWQGGSQPGTQPWAFTFGANNTGWGFTGNDDAPAARITVSAIPEPGTWALMLGGMLMVGALAKRRVR